MIDMASGREAAGQGLQAAGRRRNPIIQIEYLMDPFNQGSARGTSDLEAQG